MFELYNNKNKIKKNRYLELHNILKDDFINKKGIAKYEESNFEGEALEKWIDMIRNDKDYNILIYIIDNRIVGFICYLILDKKICLCEIQVVKEYQGKKEILKKLLKKLCEDNLNKEIDFIVATIDKDNIKSQTVFKHIGMINTHENWYQINFDDLLKWVSK